MLPYPSKCGNIVVLPIQTGCVLPSDYRIYSNSTDIFLIDWSTVQPLGCISFSHILSIIIPQVVTIGNNSVPLIVLWSPYYQMSGTLGEPYGNLSYGAEVSSIVAAALISYAAGYRLSQSPNETYCFHPGNFHFQI